MKRLSNLILEFTTDGQVTDHDLKVLENQLDVLWNKVGMDIAFTSHFLDRVNDARNVKPITIAELARLFTETYKKFAVRLKEKESGFEAVLNDIQTQINVPFVLKWNPRIRELELVAKTVMRKRNFVPNNPHEPKLQVAHVEHKGKSISEGKKMKKEKLKEWYGFAEPKPGPMDGVPAYDDVDISAQGVDNSQILARLNYFVQSITQRQYMNPYAALNQLWAKLSIIGLNFDPHAVTFDGQSGSCKVPMTMFGGRYGFTDMDGVVKQDDGISHKIPGGLSLVVSWVNVNGTYTIDALIVKNTELGVGLTVKEAKQRIEEILDDVDDVPDFPEDPSFKKIRSDNVDSIVFEKKTLSKK